MPCVADLVVTLDRVPGEGETLSAHALELHPGGKGANQAAAGALLGYPTSFVGQVGRDSNAPFLRECLATRGVRLSGLREVEGPCGTAIVMLERKTGENRIIIVGGANRSDFEILPEQEALVRSAGMLLLQQEVPQEVNMRAARIAHDAGVPVLLDAGGEDAPLPDEMLGLIDTFSPNETELGRIVGRAVATPEDAVRAARVRLVAPSGTSSDMPQSLSDRPVALTLPPSSRMLCRS